MQLLAGKLWRSGVFLWEAIDTWKWFQAVTEPLSFLCILVFFYFSFGVDYHGCFWLSSALEKMPCSPAPSRASLSIYLHSHPPLSLIRGRGNHCREKKRSCNYISSFVAESVRPLRQELSRQRGAHGCKGFGVPSSSAASGPLAFSYNKNIC